jgi:hypothetical protein
MPRRQELNIASPLTGAGQQSSISREAEPAAQDYILIKLALQPGHPFTRIA